MLQKSASTRVLSIRLLFLSEIKISLSQGEQLSQHWSPEGGQGVFLYKQGFFAVEIKFEEASDCLDFDISVFNIIFRTDAKLCSCTGSIRMSRDKSKQDICKHTKAISKKIDKAISTKGMHIGNLPFVGAEGATTLSNYKQFLPFGSSLLEFSKGCLHLMVSLQKQWLTGPTDWRVQLTEGVRGDQLKVEVLVPPLNLFEKEASFEIYIGLYNEGKTKLCGPVQIKQVRESFCITHRSFIESSGEAKVFWSETLMCFLMLLIHQAVHALRAEIKRKTINENHTN